LAKEELIEMNGVVTEVLPDSRYRVTLENDHKLIAYAGGKMKKNHIRILAGDNVTLELSPYDINNGRITFRHIEPGSNNFTPRKRRYCRLANLRHHPFHRVIFVNKLVLQCT